MSWIDRIATVVTEYSWIVIAVMVLTTAAVGAGTGAMEESSSVTGLPDDSEVSRAYDDVRADFSPREANTTTSVIAISNESGNALSKATLVRTLRYQQKLRENGTLNATLVDDRPTVSVANLVATAAIASDRRYADRNATPATTGRGTSPPLEEQIARLESMDDAEVAAVVRRVLDPERPTAASRTASRLLPRTYEPGSATAASHLLVLTQDTDGAVQVDVALSKPVSDGQRAACSLAATQPGPETYYVFGGGLVSGQQSAAISDSLAMLGPLALAFVLISLSVAYRDPIDVVLGLVGVVAVLVWTFGATGWLGIAFNQTMIAVPILLIGLSVDYALHVFMRYREERAADEIGARTAMARALGRVGPALVVVTVTTAIGFLANLTSPMGDIRSFGLVAAIGITATLIVFGLFVPALKSAISSRLGRLGWDRTPSPPGSAGRLRRALGASASIASAAPLAVVVFALVLSAGAAYGATGVDVASPDEAFMADDPPEWTATLPDAVQPGEFYLKENRRYIDSRFQTPDTQGYVLVEGNVTDPETLERVAAAERTTRRSEAVATGPNGAETFVTPLSAMERAAAQNRTFNETFHAADTDGDGVPDADLRTLYDEFYAATPDLAARTIHRTDEDRHASEDGASGRYTAVRLRMALDRDVDRATAVAPLRDSAAAFDDTDGVDATATGQPVIAKELNDRLAMTLLESLGLTLVVVLGFLLTSFRLREGTASLGAVTLVPVAFSVSWLLGTMALLDIPIGLVTALVGSISVGLGVDYAIHVSERFAEEYGTHGDAEAALAKTVTGTGGALSSSAVTTAAGFGVLSFSLLPALRQFGFILAVGIGYSFLASVFIQPSLLLLWTRYGSGSTVAENVDGRTAENASHR
ncbi:efflux RND transporter permease subunit [Natrinema salinisoli]|uniref:efflux RND transporter permease subunit n=1 Tax=Natrinema salinisoli TaxID=2878535 RepID=UPI001CEFF220|nr:MMPL family transporter [Natrinema salinisoli]